MFNLKNEFEILNVRFIKLIESLDYENKTEKLQNLKQDLLKENCSVNFYISLNKEISDLEVELNLIEDIKKNLNDLGDFIVVFEDLDEKERGDVFLIFEEVKKNIDQLEIKKIFSKKEDKLNCFLEINAGAGGSDSQDWVAILLRMYLMFCDKKGFKATVEDEDFGDVAGYKSVRLYIEGDLVYGILKKETGTHRLVRISPFNANGKRQTSFAGVFVYPKLDDISEIKIEDKDLKIDTLKSSGAGGQHVNKTESAVRVTHIPTGIVVKSQSSRSQAQNRELAIGSLKSKLYNMKLKEEEDKKNKLKESGTDISWGTQVRNYVMHPYQLVKDLRSGYETGNINKILDGDLDELMKSLFNI